jgi:FemAB-related protein (PEP-CTERM system-associated)
MDKKYLAFIRLYDSLDSVFQSSNVPDESRHNYHRLGCQIKTHASEFNTLSQQSKSISKEMGLLKKQGKDISDLLALKKQLDTGRILELKKVFKDAYDELQALSVQFSELASTRYSDSMHQDVKEDKKILPELTVKLADTKELLDSSDQFCSSVFGGTIYHLSKWKKIIPPVFHNPFHILVAVNVHGGVYGVLPIVRLQSALFGDFCVSVPYFNYGGPVAVNEEIETLLIKEACRYCDEWQISHFEIRGVKKREQLGLPFRSEKVNMLLDLPSDVESYRKSLKAKVRSQIKKAENQDYECRFGGVELLDDFYKIFSINMRDLGTPVYSKSFFKEILLNFPDNARLVVLNINGKPASCGFLMGYKHKLEIPWASTLRKFNQYNANMLMYYNILKFAIGQGYKTFDFGRSTVDCNTYKFKKQWGANPLPLYWYYWLKSGEDLPELNPNNFKFKLLIAVWKRLPVVVTNLLGPAIVSKLP